MPDFRYRQYRLRPRTPEPEGGPDLIFFYVGPRLIPCVIILFLIEDTRLGKKKFKKNLRPLFWRRPLLSADMVHIEDPGLNIFTFPRAPNQRRQIEDKKFGHKYFRFLNRWGPQLGAKMVHTKDTYFTIWRKY